MSNLIIKLYKEFLKNELEKTHEIERKAIKIDNFAYIDPYLKKQILAKIKDGSFYTFNFRGVSTTLTIAGTPPHTKIDRFLLFYTCFLIYLFKHVGSPLLKLDITLVYFKRRKMLTSGHLKPLHINSGVTSSYLTEATVVVYREEEMVKVLTHEMIHAFGLDAKNIREDQEDFVNKYFNIVCKSVTINESFTDALACYINTVMYTFYERHDDINFDIELEKNLSKERKHMLKQAEKVLVYNGYYKNGDTIESKDPVCEQTHVTSYYVIKAVIYNNLEPFVEMLKDTNMMIDVPRYIAIIKGNMQAFVDVTRLDKSSIKEKNLNMSCLNILKVLGKVKSI